MYHQEVLADNPIFCLSLGDAPGSLYADNRNWQVYPDYGYYGGPTEDPILAAQVNLGVPGLIPGTDTAAAFTGDEGSRVYVPDSIYISNNSDAATLELLFQTSQASDEQMRPLIDWSDGGTYVRAIIYMQNGHLHFYPTVFANGFQSSYVYQVSTVPVNDGQPHHVAVKVDRYGNVGTILDGVITNPMTTYQDPNVVWASYHHPFHLAQRANGDALTRYVGVLDEVTYYKYLVPDSRLLVHAEAVDPPVTGLLFDDFSLHPVREEPPPPPPPPPAPTYVDEILADTPLAYYRLGDASGSVMADASGNGRNGVYQGTPTLGAVGLLPGDSDTSVDFNSTDDLGRVAFGSWMTQTAYTVEAIIRPDTVSGTGTIVARHPVTTGGSIFSLRRDGARLGFYSWYSTAFNSVQTPVDSIAANTTYHVVAVHDGTSLRIYLNGALVVGPVAASAPYSSPTPDLTIGRTGNTGTSHEAFDGRIDEVAYYAGALSSERVLAHYEASLA